MNRILEGLRIIEGSAFVAAPSAGMTLAEMGAEVIRFDPLRGGIDMRRWPVDAAGRSYYWAGLNKGKRSIAIDLASPEGRELATSLVTAPGAGAGLFLTNFPARGWLDFASLRERRADLIMVAVTGNADGSSELDYTVNAATGLPLMTGHGAERPVNHVLPAWDLICGRNAVIGLLAAERHRGLTGAGQLVRVALSDVAMATMANLGFIAEQELGGVTREATGNDLFGAFGQDFPTRDARRVMLVAITARQWRALVEATEIAPAVDAIETASGLDLAQEGDRYQATGQIVAAILPWVRARDLAEIRIAFQGTGVCRGPYQDVGQMLAEDARASTANAMFERVRHPGIGETLTPGSPIEFGAQARVPVLPAPKLGEHTDRILAEILGLDGGAIGRLHDRGVVACADEAE